VRLFLSSIWRSRLFSPDTGASHIENLKRTGGLGRERNTGISTSPDMREKNGMIWKRGNMDQAGAEAEQDTAIRS